MARKTISQLTGLFENGDTPSGADFASIFDSNFNLQETGTSVASGSLTLLGGQTISGSLKISGSILPDGSGSHDLGSEAHPWGEIYVISSSINFMSNDGRKLATISVDADGKLETIPSGSTTPDPIASFPFTGSATISGSMDVDGFVSASSFSGDGSGLTNLPASSTFPYSGSAIISSSFTAGDTNSNVLKLIGSGSVSGSGLFEIEGSTGTLFSAVDSMTGSLMSVTDASGIPILEVFSDATVEAKGFKGYRPIETRAASFVLQLSDMGTYNRCGGTAITASLSASSAIPFAIGTEIEFFQTSSAGNLLITASAGSGITLNSKDGNLKLAGQFSAATLKKVGTNEWDLVGDLT